MFVTTQNITKRPVFYIFGIDLFTVALFSLTEPHAKGLVSKVILGTDVLQFLQYSLLSI
jgi:hypothetical protein